MLFKLQHSRGQTDRVYNNMNSGFFDFDWALLTSWLNPWTWLRRLWWRYWPGETVVVRYPAEQAIGVRPGHPRWYDVGATWVEIYTCDPNDLYRPYLEQHVGRQGWDWDWKLHWAGTSLDTLEQRGSLKIKVRRKHAAQATAIALMWN